MVGSLNKNQQVMDSIVDSIYPAHLSRVAGAGNKALHILDNKSDFYMNLVPGFKYWDMCASEALI